MKKLIKSYKFWTALAGAMGLFVTAISEHIGINISAEGVKEIIMAFCGVLVVFGIVKKPNTSETQNLSEQTEQTQDQLNSAEKDVETKQESLENKTKENTAN